MLNACAVSSLHGYVSIWAALKLYSIELVLCLDQSELIQKEHDKASS